MSRCGLIGWVVLWVGLGGCPAHAQKYHNVPGVIHLDSDVSGGQYSPEELIRMVRDHKLKVAVVTDHIVKRWEYGFGPLGSLMARISGHLTEMPSISTFGAERYVELIEKLDRKYPEVTVLHGAEAIPFYYWEGSARTRNLALRNGNKHLLVIGLDKPSDYQGLPTVGRGFGRRLGLSSVIALWPVVLIAWGIRWMRVKRSRVVNGRLAQSHRPYGVWGAVCVLAGVLILISNYPFSVPEYDPHHGDQGAAPYQDFIDYVNKKQGLVFWAHPGAHLPRVHRLVAHPWLRWLIPPQQLLVETPPYHRDLLATHSYTGFGAFAEGIKHIVPAGGIWDKVLLQYCDGLRDKPVWAIGEVDYEEDKFSITEVQTVFLLQEQTKRAVLDALAGGKMYALLGTAQGGSRIALDVFTVEGASGGGQAYMGDQITTQGPPRIRVSVSSRGPVTLKLIRDGQIISQLTSEGDLKVDFTDTDYQPGRLGYYRLDIEGPARILTNPIFVRRDS